MAVETRTVSYYTCDADSCDVGVYREVEYDGLPAGYHGTVSHVDGDGNATGCDYYSCIWDHVPAAMSGAMNSRGEAIENHTVPQHHTEHGNVPTGSGGMSGSSNSGRSQSASDTFTLGGTSYAGGHASDES